MTRPGDLFLGGLSPYEMTLIEDDGGLLSDAKPIGDGGELPSDAKLIDNSGGVADGGLLADSSTSAFSMTMPPNKVIKQLRYVAITLFDCNMALQSFDRISPARNLSILSVTTVKGKVQV